MRARWNPSPRPARTDEARCATLLRQQGASLEDVRDLLRHARITTTEIYAHVTDELRRETAQRLDDVFRLG
ncbi:MAG: hypothetical protein M3N52_07545 [Actinomycetota bacterium]|nr:hypothetical protein [Actinomycetota bacterium]